MPLLTTFAGPSNKGGASSLLTGLVAFWKGDSTADSGPNGYTLTNTNAATFTAGKIGNAFTLASASTQYLSVADNANLSMGGTDFSISLWAKFTSRFAFEGLVSKGNAQASGGEYLLAYDNATGKLMWTIRQTGNVSSDNVLSLTTVTDATWYHVVCTFATDTNVAAIYLDNDAGSSKTLSGGVGYGLDGSNAVNIGRWAGGGSTMNGQIDAVGIWRKVLSAGERATLYQGGTGLEYPF